MIDRQRYARVKEIFLQALRQREEAQRRFLDEACGPDREMRREVESLLRYHLGQPEGSTLVDETPEEDGSGA